MASFLISLDERAALYIHESRSLPGCIAADRSFSKNHKWFVQAFESGIMDHDFTVRSALIGGIVLSTGHGLPLSPDVAKVVAAIGAILATAMAYVQRSGAMLLLGIPLCRRSDRFPLPRLLDIVTQASEYGSLYVVRR
jgi:hypothetical protein